jgi:hypothetical protein
MYGKIYEQTFTGSMYGSGSCIFAVWSYVIAHTKPDAMIELNPMELASKIGEDLARIEAAIEHFKSPDPKSRSKEFEGRRLIQKGEFIYFVPQYHKYHGFANNKERREYFALKKREQRQRDKDCQTAKSKESKNVKQSNTQSESETKPKTISFLEALKLDPTHSGIDIDYEFEKAHKWCQRKNRRLTQRFFEIWLTKADRFIVPIKPQYNHLPPVNETPDEQRAAVLNIAHSEVAKLAAQFKMK